MYKYSSYTKTIKKKNETEMLLLSYQNARSHFVNLIRGFLNVKFSTRQLNGGGKWGNAQLLGGKVYEPDIT